MPGSRPRIDRPHRPHQGIEAGEFYRDGAYQNWRSRGTSDWLLIYTISGAGRVGTPEAERVSRPGILTLYEPGTTQYYYTDPDVGHWHLRWAHFYPRPHWEPWLRWNGFARGLHSAEVEEGETRDRVESVLGECVRAFSQQGPCSLDFALNALERVFLLVFSCSASRDVDPRIRRATETLLREIRSPFSLADLARTSGLSLSRLTQLFTRETGLPPRRYLESLRLRHACHLLRSTSRTIKEVADHSGFADPFYFSNRFRKTFGVSPTEFRKRR